MVLAHSFVQFKTVEDNLSELILEGNQIEGKAVTIDHDGTEFKYDIHDRTANSEEEMTSSIERLELMRLAR